jgi:hypothetical protein
MGTFRQPQCRSAGGAASERGGSNGMAGMNPGSAAPKMIDKNGLVRGLSSF